jgi:hypothetical protein
MKKKIVEPKEKRYCSFCGEQLIELLEGAEKNMMYYGHDQVGPFDSRYDEKTGQRNYCYRYICPKWKRIFFGLFYSSHDNYFIDKTVRV